MKIELKGRSFQTALFDKRDSFPFSIVRMPYKSSNIPSKTFYATIGAEILRIGRASSTPESFSCAGKQIVQRMLRQGADANKLSKSWKEPTVGMKICTFASVKHLIFLILPAKHLLKLILEFLGVKGWYYIVFKTCTYCLYFALLFYY